MSDSSYDETIELQWKGLVEKTKSKYNACNYALAVVDVSGSMIGLPMSVAISLGAMLAECIEGPFKNKIITFSNTPSFVDITADTLKDKVKKIAESNWQMNTNLVKTFELILNFAKIFSVPESQMPKTIYIFSDMQFDQAAGDNTNLEYIDRLYIKNEYTRPNIVFWNLRGNTIDFPANITTPRTALVSGFSQSLFNIITDGEALDPLNLVYKILDSERYKNVII